MSGTEAEAVIYPARGLMVQRARASYRDGALVEPSVPGSLGALIKSLVDQMPSLTDVSWTSRLAAQIYSTPGVRAVNHTATPWGKYRNATLSLTATPLGSHHSVSEANRRVVASFALALGLPMSAVSTRSAYACAVEPARGNCADPVSVGETPTWGWG